MNTAADLQSRTVTGSAEWRLDPKVFRRIAAKWGPVDIDLFATRLNALLSKYISRRPDPFAVAVDALQTAWAEWQGYAFPPFCLLGTCLKKIACEQATLILIVPVWPHQPWYPLLLESLVELLLLPPSPTLLLDPFNQPHPLMLSGNLQLAAWKVSRVASLKQAFQTRLQRSSPLGGAVEPMQHTNLLGRNGSTGASAGKLLPFLPL